MQVTRLLHNGGVTQKAENLSGIPPHRNKWAAIFGSGGSGTTGSHLSVYVDHAAVALGGAVKFADPLYGEPADELLPHRWPQAIAHGNAQPVSDLTGPGGLGQQVAADLTDVQEHLGTERGGEGGGGGGGAGGEEKKPGVMLASPKGETWNSQCSCV